MKRNQNRAKASTPSNIKLSEAEQNSQAWIKQLHSRCIDVLNGQENTVKGRIVKHEPFLRDTPKGKVDPAKPADTRQTKLDIEKKENEINEILRKALLDDEEGKLAQKRDADLQIKKRKLAKKIKRVLTPQLRKLQKRMANIDLEREAAEDWQAKIRSIQYKMNACKNAKKLWQDTRLGEIRDQRQMNYEQDERKDLSKAIGGAFEAFQRHKYKKHINQELIPAQGISGNSD